MRDLALALIIFGLLPFILTSPYVGVLVWSWLSYMNPHRLTWGFAYSFPWVQLVAITTILGFLLSSKEKFRIPVKGVTICFLLLMGWMAVTSYYSFVPDVAWDRFNVHLKIMVLVFFTLMLVQTRERLHWLMWVIAVSIGFYGIKGGLFVIATGGQYVVVGPSQSFIHNSNDIALAMAMAIPIMRYLQLQEPKKWIRIGLWGAMGLTSVAILGTYSRGGMLTLGAVLLMLFWKTRGKFILAVLGAIAIPIMLTLVPQQWYHRMGTIDNYQQDESAMGRIQSWKFATQIALDRPLVGGGFRPYLRPDIWRKYAPPNTPWREIHSIYFKVLGEQGFVGFGIFILLLFLSWRNLVWIRKRTKGIAEWKWAYDLSSMLYVSGVAYCVGGAFLPLPYFDLAYQLLAVGLLVRCRVAQDLSATESVRPSVAHPHASHASKELPA
ncbi:MAG TPA: putative O-glycosylation ligase, exosortase A system-associated [Gammaproteobacteria bacterium]|nr:putative O-glycosylation ligase, exosortase A system-associated [Gammaproteobacteria bacterium]